MIAVTLQRPWLIARLPRPMRVLSWAPCGGGWRTTATILWREVRNAELTRDFDAEGWLAAQMPDPGAVGMLTSRDLGSWCAHQARVEDATAACIATLGLSNAESVGRRLPYHSADYGTINLAVALDLPGGLGQSAQIEALSIAVQARTAAVIEAGLSLATGLATGTGTDCIALACDAGTGRYAGLHTPAGEALGAAVRTAVARAARDWIGWRDARRAAPTTEGPNPGEPHP